MIITNIARHSVRLIRSASSVTFSMAPTSFDYDLAIIGGGSGGLAASKVSVLGFLSSAFAFCSIFFH